MQLAYNQALKAWKMGEIPIGAVAVCNQTLLKSAYNQVETQKDATAHAEMLLIRSLSQNRQDWRLGDTTLYVTKEPCPMCTGAIFKARISAVVIGVSDVQQGCLGGCIDFNQMLKLYHQVRVRMEGLNGACEKLLKSFFQLRRKTN